MKMSENKQPRALPGDAMAVSEEYLPGNHAYDADGTIRALQTGVVVKDLQQREINVKSTITSQVPNGGGRRDGPD